MMPATGWVPDIIVCKEKDRINAKQIKTTSSLQERERKHERGKETRTRQTYVQIQQKVTTIPYAQLRNRK
jgi:hypothetical protein